MLTKGQVKWSQGVFEGFLAKKSILAVAIALMCVYVSVYFSALPSPELDLTQYKWRACMPSQGVSGCDYRDTVVPMDAVRFDSGFASDITYEVSFTTPEYCRSERNVCVVFVSEVGDAARVYLNGRLVGEHGKMPPSGVYAKHYPLRITLPHLGLDLRGPNRLTFEVHSFKRAQSGIRKGPVGIYSEANAFFAARVQVAQTIVLPLMSAFALFLIGLTALAWAVRQEQWHRDVESLVLYCGFVGAFLLSFSEIVREVVPVHWAGLVHHILRLTGDLFFFQLVRACFLSESRIWNRIATLYWIVIGICPVAAVYFYFTGTLATDLFDFTYLVRRLALPLLLFPHILGIWAAFRSPRANARIFLVGVFLLTAAFQINDSLIFHGVMSGTYLVKTYPVLIGLSLGYSIFRRHAEEAILREAHLAADAMIGRVTKQAAHDIRSPVSALMCAASILHTRPEEAAALINSATKRVNTIAQDLLDSGTSNAGPKEAKQPSDLFQLVRGLVLEKRLEYRKDRDIEILDFYEGESQSHHVLSELDIGRILSNLINNSVEASNGTNQIRVGTSVDNGVCKIVVEDKGQGVSAELLSKLNSGDRLWRKTTKVSGNGLGLQSARSDLSRVGGSLQIESRIGVGTKVTMRFPTGLHSIVR